MTILRNKIYLLTILICVLSGGMLFGQQIFIDGEFSDWDAIAPIAVDETGDGQNNGVDFTNVWIHNDAQYIYIRFETNREIDLSENSDLAIYLDYDNNINTGFKINGIGAEVRYFFGDRFGIVDHEGDSEFVNFWPLGLIAAPTVTGSQFECVFRRQIDLSNISFEAETTIAFRIEDNGFSGDEIPSDLEGIEYTLGEGQLSIPEPVFQQPANTEFRIMTYNIERDQLFESARYDNFRRIFQATTPDIIALQEVRDFDSDDVKSLIEEFVPNGYPYHDKIGFDIVVVSKYPILFSEFIAGNGAFYLDVDGQEVLVLNCHLPCCDNDIDRQQEVDAIMEYVRDIKSGQGNFVLDQGSPIIILGDMNFVGDRNQPYTFETGDIFANGIYGPDFNPDWDETPLKEANAYATGSFSNLTWLNRFGDFLPGKLDYIYYTDSKLRLENTYTLYTLGLSQQQLAENNLEFGDDIFAADHFPVIADFSYQIVNVDDFVDIDFRVYPNPASNLITIDGLNEKISSISILNTVGNSIFWIQPEDNRSAKLDISNLPSGKYYIMIQTDNGRAAKALIKI